MTLHLTRDEADRLTADGRVVLFRAGEPIDDLDRFMDALDIEGSEYGPPAEFVEAAKPCETCVPHRPNSSVIDDCPDCLDGKRRIAAVVPCGCSCHKLAPAQGVHCRCMDVTVGHVVVTWGPAEVRPPGDNPDEGSYFGPAHVIVPEVGQVGRYFPAWDGSLDWDDGFDITIPPDVDPQPLVGQYALGIEAAS